MAEKLIYDILKGKNTLDPELKKSRKSSKALSDTISSVSGSVLNLKSAFVGGFAVLAVRKAIKEAKEFEAALVGLDRVAAATGNDVGFIRDEAKKLAADGLIPLINVSNSLKNLLATGFDGEKAVKVFKALRDSAAFNRQGQLELGEAIEGASQGLKNDLSIKVDNAGITKNLSNIQKEYAATIGKSIGSLTEAEKIQGKYVGILKEAGIFQGDYNELLKTYSGVSSEVAGRTRFFVAELGSLITNSPQVISSLKDTANTLKTLTDVIKDNAPQLTSLIGKLTEFLLITPSKFWLTLLTEGVEAAGNIASVSAEIKSLGDEANNLQGLLQQASKNPDLLTSMGISKEQVTADLAATISRIQELEEEIRAFDESQKQRAVTTKTIKVEDDARVKRERAVNALLEEIRKEQKIAQDELKELQGEQDTLEDEEKLINLQAQIRTEAEIKKLGREQEVLEKAKTLKDIEKAEAESNNRRLKKEKQVLTDRLANQRAWATGTVNIASGAANLITAVTKKGSKAAFIAQRAAAIASSIIATQAAAAQALAVPVAPNVPLQTVALVAGGLNTAAIIATTIKGFQGGGALASGTRVGTRSGDGIIFRGNEDEGVFTRAQMSRLFDIADGKVENRQEDDETIGGDIVINVDGREIIRVIRDQKAKGVRI